MVEAGHLRVGGKNLQDVALDLGEAELGIAWNTKEGDGDLHDQTPAKRLD